MAVLLLFVLAAEKTEGTCGSWFMIKGNLWFTVHGLR